MRTKKKNHKKKKSSSKHGPVISVHPLSQIPREIALKGMVEIGKSNQVKFHILFTKVTDILKSYNSLHIISSLSMYGLTAGVTVSGKISPFLKKLDFGQPHVELVQALALQIPEGEMNVTLAGPDTFQELYDSLPELGNAFALQRLVSIEQEKTDQQKSIQLLQEHLRLHTQNIRNWGYFKKVLAISKSLYEPLNPLYQDHIGISATILISAFESHLRKIEEFGTARMMVLREIFQEPTAEGMIRQYYRHNPYFLDGPEEMIEYSRKRDFSREQIKIIVLTHSDLSLSEMFTMSSQNMATSLGVSPELFSNALDKLSLSFGSLAGQNPEYIFLDNPIWTRPLIRVGGGRYFCAMPQIFFCFIFQIFDDLAKDNDHLRTSLYERRSAFLELEVARLFTTAFPGSEHAFNYRWKDSEAEYENDLIIRVDSHLLLIEAKSGSISWPALRGAPDRAKRHVEELLFDPSNQSYRLEARINEAISKPELRDSLLPDFPISLDLVKSVLRLSVTLEDFGVLQSNLHMARDAGWISGDHPLAACILLADLEIVLDILEPTAQKIHYLKRRSELEANMNYSGDELDILGFYLMTGFNVGNVEFDGQPLMLNQSSSKIDDYYIALDHGILRDKPKLKLSKWWRDICARLEDRDFHQWSDVAYILLNFSYPEQKYAEAVFKKIKKNVFKNWRQEKHRSAVVITPNIHRSDAIAFYAFRDREKGYRQERMKNIASQVFKKEHVQRCVILGLNIDKDHYPYSSLLVFMADENGDSTRR